MLLLGIDEGTTGVKAALFDEALRPVREARRDKVSRHPQPGWVEQDGEEVLAAVVEAVAELLEGAPGEVVACGLDHQGESVLAWDAESGKTLSPIVVWQDKRSQEVLSRLGAAEDEIRDLSGLPFDPYFSAAKLAWLLENDDGVARAREGGTLRMGTVDSFLCDRLGAGFATDASTASRTQLHALGTPGFDARLGELFGVPLDVLPEVRDTAGELGVLRHESWPVELRLCGQVVDQQAALFDERLTPVREARRDKVNRHPQPGWVEQDGEEVLAAVVEAVAELLADAPAPVVACGRHHQGESVLAWDAETGTPLTPIVVWQDKRSQEVLDRMSEHEPEIQERSGLPFDPYFSAAKLAWLLEHDDGVQRARDAGTLRMGTVDSFLCDRLGAGFATDASTASRTQLHALGTPGFDERLG